MARPKTITSGKTNTGKAEAAETERKTSSSQSALAATREERTRKAPTLTEKSSAKRPGEAVPSAAPQPVIQPAPAPEQAPGSKQAGIIAALRRPEGGTLAELMRLTSWQPHSVRGVLSGALKRKLGLVIDSRVEPERGRVYRIVEPAKVKAKVTASKTASPPASAKARRAKPRGSTAQVAA